MDIDLFSPIGSTVNLAVTTSSGRVALTTVKSSSSVRVYNAGAATAFVQFGDSTVAAATATSIPIPSGAIEVFGIGEAITHVAGITASGTATLYCTSGLGA